MDEQLNRMAGVSPSAKTFTPKEGPYLAYIHLYMRLRRRPQPKPACSNIFAQARLPFTAAPGNAEPQQVAYPEVKVVLENPY